MFGWFRKKDKTPLPAAEATPAIEYLSIQEDLAALMRGHGLDVQSHDDWLLVGNDVPLLRGTYNIDNRTGDSITTQIDIELRLSAERSIYEHYAGVDRDERQSMGQGLFKFCCGAFHVFSRPSGITTSRTRSRSSVGPSVALRGTSISAT